jgi:hypothetical protein
MTLSEIVKNFFNLYCVLMRIAPKAKLKAFYEAGFIGCGEGDPLLSENYKKDLMEVMRRKC